jgi:hypothetical protein
VDLRLLEAAKGGCMGWWRRVTPGSVGSVLETEPGTVR